MLYSGSVTPTTELFIRDFGVESPLYKQCCILLEEGWKKVREKSEVKILYKVWSKYLEIVHGSKVASENLFLRHTYLSTLAKLMASMHYLGGRIPSSDEEYFDILTGRYFVKWGIHLFEEDFFSWIVRVPEIGLKLARIIVERLSKYDFSNLNEDILKGLYQQLVYPKERHDLGEYYTPDWLAEYIVRDVLDTEKSALDPACGSGTFLVKAIHLKRELLKNEEPSKVLEHILNSVVGMDIHPLAVILSRVNYLLALGELIYHRSEKVPEIYIPMYLANSIFPPRFEQDYSGIGKYSFKVNGTFFNIPASLAERYHEFDVVIDVIKDVAKRKSDDIELLERLLKNRGISLKKEEMGLILSVTQTMGEFISEGRDTIWAFILKNIYKPIFFGVRKFDCIVGNPPWLSYRYISSVEYREDIKKLIMKTYRLLPTEKVELITQMELATLFFLRVSDLYLVENGVIEFVMPRSVFSADQHDSFRKGLYRMENINNKLGIVKIIDLEKVSPLFNVPSCVIKGVKGINTQYPVEGKKFIGKLPKKNASLDEALENLEIKNCQFRVVEIGKRSFITDKEIEISLTGSSYYTGRFYQGAAIVPRTLWFVEIKKEALGINPRTPYVETSERAISQAKEQYANINLSGYIESDFLYFVITGPELIPFAFLPLPIAVLPIQPMRDRYRLVTKEEARNRGYMYLAEWLEKAEKIWKQNKSPTTNKALLERLNYRNKLTQQNPSKRFRVVYNTSGTYVVSSVIDLHRLPTKVKIDGIGVRINGLIVDNTCYCFETGSEDEAYYLSGVLNAPVVDELIKDMQTKRPQHIHKKVLELPIPKYNPKNEIHRQLAHLGRVCEQKSWSLLPKLIRKYKSVGKIRSLIKIELENELLEISKLVLKIFEGNITKTTLEYWSN